MSTTITASKANIQNATTTNLNVAKITGSVIATPKEIKDGIVTNKVVTPFSAKLALSLFTSLGNSGTNANFTTVTMTDFAGNVIADSKTAIAGVSSSKIITPLTLLSVLNNPGKIGLQTPNNSIFTNITADSVQGDVIAMGSEISAGTVNNKVVSPFELYNSLQAPSIIGGSNPGSAKFTNVTANTLNLTTDILQVNEGGLGINSFNRGDILVASESSVISKLSSGKDGQFLQADSKEPFGMKWVDSPAPPQTNESITGATNTEALNSSINSKALVPSNLPSLFQAPYPIGSASAPDATFTTMTINGSMTLTNPIGPKSGGTSIKSYSKGDLLVATDQYSLTTLPVGNKDKYLLADSTASTGLKWDSVAFGSASGYPSGYSSIGQITKINNHKYTISYVNARNATDNDNISLNNQTFDFSSVNSTGNAIYCGSRITGTVTVNGSHLLGTGTTFTNLTIGNYISVENINFRIMDIISDTDLVVDKSCAQTSGVTMTMPTVGSTLSTTNYKFGSSSLYVTASNYLSVNNVQFNKTFTIECWINVSNLGGDVNIVNFNSIGIQIYYNASNNVVAKVDSNSYNSLIPFVRGKWQHFAISNDGSNAYVFIDGKMAIDLSKLGTINQMVLWPVYLFQSSSSSNIFYVDSLKISNYGKYTSEFIPCEKQFTMDPCTTMICQFEGANGSTTYNIDTLDTTTSFAPYNSYDLSNKRLHMYATSGTGIVFHYLNSNAGDDISNMGPSSVVQLPYYIDMNVNGLVNIYGLTKNKTISDSYDRFTITGNSITTKYNILDNLSNSVVENNQAVSLETLSIDPGVSQSVYKSTVLNGTVSVSGTTITGTDTTFTTSFVVGDYIHVIATQEKLLISAITNSTTLTVSTSATTTSGSYYYKYTTVTPTITSTPITGLVDIYGNTVTGTGTSFSTELLVGDIIKGRNGAASIKSIASNTSLSLSSNINSPNIDSTVSNQLSTTYCVKSYCMNLDSFSQTTPQNQPVFASSGGLNNRPYYTFTSSLSMTTASKTLNINTNGGFTIFLLLNPTISNIGSSYVFKTSLGSFTQIQIGGNNGNLEFRMYNSTGIVTYFNSVVYSNMNSTSTWYLFTFRYSKATNQMQFYVNKSLTNTLTNNQSTIPDVTGISSLSNDVNIGAFYLYDSLLSSQEVTDMNNYLYSGASFPSVSVNPSILFEPVQNKNIVSISTSQSKFGSSSLKSLNSITGVNLNTFVPNNLKEYTVDFWIYSTTNTGALVSWASQAFAYTSSIYDRLELYMISGTVGLFRAIPLGVNTQTISQTNIGSLTANSWNHVAICQDLNMFCIYLNGVSAYSTTTINPISPNVLGSIQFGKGFAECYIDEISVCNINKYITAFTPSTTEYSRKVSSLTLKHFNGTDGSTDINVDRINEVQGETLNKIVHGNLELALRGTLYGFGKLVYNQISTFSSDIMAGDRLYLPLVSKTVSVTNVLANDLLMVSENITPQSNVNNCNWSACGQAILSRDEKLFGPTSLFIQNNTYNARSYAVVKAPSNCYLTNGWTIEFNFYNTHKGSGTNTIFTMRTRNSASNNSPGRNSLSLLVNDASSYILSLRNDDVITSASAAMRTGMWHHVAIVCTGTSVTLYLSGKLIGSVAYTGNTGVDYFVFGANDIFSNPINSMYYDEFRLSSNARYSTGFNVPQKRYQWDEYTLLLNHFDGPNGSNNLNMSEEAFYGYKVENMIGYPIMGWGQNNNPITSLTGSVYLNDNIVYGVNTTFIGKFNPGDNIVVGGQKYKILKVISDTSMLVESRVLVPLNRTNGATLSTTQYKFGTKSLSLNGSSYMNISNLGKKLFCDPFTIEAWVYPTVASGLIMSTAKANSINDGQIAFVTSNSSLRVIYATKGSGSVTTTSSNQLTLNDWNHIALCVTPQTISIFANGVMTSQNNTNGMMQCLDTNLILGSNYDYSTFFTGYIDELRISSMCRYNSNFTVPASIFNNDSQTVLLYHFEDTVLHSNTGIAIPVGDTSISTSTTKFGSGSVAFGTFRNGHLKLSGFNVNSGVYTIEFWLYLVENPATEASIFSMRSSRNSALGINLTISNSILTLYLNSSNSSNSIWSTTLTTAFSTFNSWTHVAMVCNPLDSGGIPFRFFVGGVQKLTNSIDIRNELYDNSNIIFNECDPNMSQYSGIYGYKPVMTGKSFYGYIDDIRVSNNARYSSGFTVPSSAFTSDSNTLYLLNCDSISSLNPSNLMSLSNDIFNAYPNTFDYGIQKQSSSNHLYTYLLSEKNKSSQLMLSPANIDNNESLILLPSGYAAKNAKQLPFIVSYGPDGHLLQSTFVNKRMAFTNRPKYTTLISSTATWHELSIGHHVPANSNMVSCLVEVISSAGFVAQFSANSNGSSPRIISNSGSSKYSVNTMLPCSNGKIYIRCNVNNAKISVTLMGYNVNL